MPQFNAVEALGLISYSYTAAVLNEFIKLDFGAVEIPYWVIADHANKVIEDYKDDQIINLTEGGGVVNTFDYGSITEVQAVASEDWGQITDSSNIEAMGSTLHVAVHLVCYQDLLVLVRYSSSVDPDTDWMLHTSFLEHCGLLALPTLIMYLRLLRRVYYLRSDTKVAYAPNWNVFGTLFSGVLLEELSPRYSQRILIIRSDKVHSLR